MTAELVGPGFEAGIAGGAVEGAAAGVVDADLERRFGGLKRLWGDDAYQRVRSAHIAVIGIGGVGSWVAEALARCGVGALTLIDMDHVAESNINRQIQALGRTLGAAKIEAMAERIRDIHPGCRLTLVDDFVTADNWPALLPATVDVLVDACDQARAKHAMARWSLAQRVPIVIVGAAGGKSQAHRVEVADLADVSHDPMLARLRAQLRRDTRSDQTDGAPAKIPSQPDRRRSAATPRRFDLTCVFSREEVRRPDGTCEVDGSLNCAGYGSCVTVTASFGMVAAAQAMELLRRRNEKGR